MHRSKCLAIEHMNLAVTFPWKENIHTWHQVVEILVDGIIEIIEVNSDEVDYFGIYS